ncbi:transcriptional regulator [Frigoriglobus tundricola]|uniref:Transcriptional regulator, MarR family n=1 Tax=Frigoriglobus tundricola TaxID=2774151 RepID=A0A6M5YNT8_9BACT|nr:transcriptional regulator [Frigoriglobus tundricola]QJW95030.1 Transcriptional regulator, MarR family [Frigoriglobus tundricola]
MPDTEPGAGDAGRFAYEGLDRVLHEKARLGILTALVTHPEGLSFSDLTRLCDLTDGNLSRHLDVLAEAGLVKITKGFEGRRPHTTCALTAQGRKRFRAYLTQLEKVLRDAAAQEDGRAAKAQTRPGLAGA